jgi:DNA-binding transcriptional LysR family regulator
VLIEKFPKVRLRLLSSLTGELFNRMLGGELDVAVVFLPEGKTAPSPLLTNIIASDRMEIVQSSAGNIDDTWESLSRAPWVLNPSGCLLRASLIDQMECAGFTPMVAAEIHYNMHLQLALIRSGCGVGLLPARFIARNNSLDTFEVLRPPSFDLRLSVAVTRIPHLGDMERAVELLEGGIRHLFESENIATPVSRSRKGVPASRQAARPRR